jgi:hypothetical protein
MKVPQIHMPGIVSAPSLYPRPRGPR